MDFAKSSLKLFLANVLSSGIGFLGIVFFARELDPTGMGVFFLFQALVGMVAIPADMGLRGALEKRLSEDEDQGEFLTGTFILKLIPLACISLVVLLFRSPIEEYVGAEVAMLLILGIILREIAMMSIATLKGELRVGEIAILKVTRQITWVAVGALLVVSGFGPLGIIYGLIAGFFVWALSGWLRVSTTPRLPSKDHLKSLGAFGKYNLISSIGGYFYSWMDIAIIGYILTQKHVGAYESAWRITMIVLLMSEAISTTLFPQISQWNAEDFDNKIIDTIREALLGSILLVIPAFFGTILFSEEILQYLFGSQYVIASVALIILMGEKLFQSVHVILGQTLRGINRPDLAAYATVISLFTNLVLNVAFISHFGIVGAAFATTISFSINTVLHGYYLSKFMRIEFPLTEIAWCIFSSIAMSGVLLVLLSQFPVNSLADLIFTISIGAISYFSSILISKSLRIKLLKHVPRV